MFAGDRIIFATADYFCGGGEKLQKLNRKSSQRSKGSSEKTIYVKFTGNLLTLVRTSAHTSSLTSSRRLRVSIADKYSHHDSSNTHTHTHTHTQTAPHYIYCTAARKFGRRTGQPT